MTGADEPEAFVGRDWILDRIAGWFDGPSPLLALVAPPGWGKSALARRTAKVFDGVSALHCCSHNDFGTVDPTRVLESVAAELTQTVPGYGKELLNTETTTINVEQTIGMSINSTVTAIGRINLGKRVPRDAFYSLLRVPFGRLSGHQSAVVLIDGLDEATGRDAGEYTLADLLCMELLRPVPGLRFIITTRRGIALPETLGRTVIDLDDDHDHGIDDVRRYAVRSLARPPGPDVDYLAARIAAASGGNFLIGELLTALVRDRPSDGGDLDDLPDNLADAYTLFLDRFLVSDREPWWTTIRPVLGALCEARGDGFTPMQVAEITGLARSKVDDAIKICNQILAGPAGPGPVRLFHSSLSDYLRRDGKFHVYPAEIRRRVVAALYAQWRSTGGRPEPYVTRHLLTHVVDALADHEPLDGPGPGEILLDLATDLAFVNESVAAAGVDQVLGELGIAAGRLATSSPAVYSLHRSIERQAHHLRGWNPAAAPAYLLQQLHNDSAASGEDALRIAAVNRLDAIDAPCGLLRWTTYHPGDALRGLKLAGQKGMTGAMALTPAGGLVTASAGAAYVKMNRLATLALWDLTTGRKLSELERPTADTGVGGTVCLALSLDGRLAAAPGDDGSVWVWDLRTEKVTAVLPVHRDGVGSVALTRDGSGAVTVSKLGVVRRWRFGCDTAEWTYDPGFRNGARVYLSVDCRRGVLINDYSAGDHGMNIVVGCRVVGPPQGFDPSERDQSVGTVLDLASGTVTHVLIGHTGPIRSVAIAPDAMTAVTASADRTARVWDLTTGLARLVLRGHESEVGSVALSGDGRRVVTGAHGAYYAPLIHYLASLDNDALVPVDAVNDRELLVEAILAANKRLDVAVGRVTDRTVRRARASDGTARVWDATTGRQLALLPNHTGDVRILATDDNATRVVTASSSAGLKMWDVESTTVVHSLPAEYGAPVQAILAPDGRSLVTLAMLQSPQVWRLAGEPQRVAAAPHHLEVHALCCTPDGRRLISMSQDGSARLWDLATGAVLGETVASGTGFSDVALSPDGTVAALISAYRSARVVTWDLQSGRTRPLRSGHSRPIVLAHFAADGDHLVTTSLDGTRQVLDRRTGARIGQPERISEPVVSSLELQLALVDARREDSTVTPDGRLGVTVTGGQLRASEVTSGATVWTFGHEDQREPISAVTVAHNGRWIAAAVAEDLIIVDATTGKPLLSVSTHRRITAVAAVPTQVAVACGTENGDVFCVDLRELTNQPTGSGE